MMTIKLKKYHKDSFLIARKTSLPKTRYFHFMKEKDFKAMHIKMSFHIIFIGKER